MHRNSLRTCCDCQSKTMKSYYGLGRCLFPFCLLFLSLLSSIDVSSSSSNIQAPYLQLQPVRLNNSYFALRGSKFLLNCTVRVRNEQDFNVSWQHNGEWLSRSVRKIDNATVQLRLFDTTSSDNGMYWCGAISGNKSQGVNISLTVADPPSPPRNLKSSVVGVYPLTQIRLSWSSSSYTGGLPVNYSIKVCKNDSITPGACKWIKRAECKPVNVLSMKRDFLCILDKSDFKLSLGDMAYAYNISVIAANAVGSARTVIYLPYVGFLEVTPMPPKDFTVDTDKEGELRVRWTRIYYWDVATVKPVYLVLYHAEDEMENKTKIINNKEFTLLTGLKDFMYYYIYLAVKLINHTDASWSETIGPCVVKTPSGNPVHPPMVNRHHSVIFPGNSGLRNVTVEWKSADSSFWHGTPGNYIISCKYHIGLKEVKNCHYSTDANSTRVVLQRLKSAYSYDVFLEMRNAEGKLSRAPSEAYVVKKLEENETLPSPTQGRKLSTAQIAVVTVSVVVGCVLVFVAVYQIRKWRRAEKRRTGPGVPLQKRIQLDPPLPYYDYPDKEVGEPAEGDYHRLHEDHV